MTVKKWCILVLTLLMCLSCASAEEASGSWLASVLGEERAQVLLEELEMQELPEEPQKQETPEEPKKPDVPDHKPVPQIQKSGYAGLIYIEDEISEYSFDYDHIGTLNLIDELIEDEKNAAIVLYMNTPGGSLYEADELYHQLQLYKKETGRPVYAYMAQECCSAGVYVAMAADRIGAAKMSLTGSVGVYMSTYSQAGLFEKLGIETEYIVTGENKIAGYPELTQAQREIYQALVDEGFESFKEVVMCARGLSADQLNAFADGRLLTAKQAKAAGLIDDVLYYDEFIETILDDLGGDAEIRDVTPVQHGADFDKDQLLQWLIQMVPQMDAEQKNGAQRLRTGGLKS